MRKKHCLNSLLALALFALPLASAQSFDPQSPPSKMRSLFLDEFSSTEGIHLEDFYALEYGKDYTITFDMRKAPGMNSKASSLAVFTRVAPNDSPKKLENHFFIKNLGAAVPADGEWHSVTGSFSVKAPDGMRIRPDLNGALGIDLILYNKQSNGKAASIRNISGVPLSEDYKFLGEKDANLPQILLIGDSTMQHTYRATCDAFDGKASVYFIPVNGGRTSGSVRQYRRWVGDKKWDLIYFNSGIHDLTRSNPKTGKRGAEFPNQVPLDDYLENLKHIVSYLKSTDTPLIWRSITPFLPKAKGRSAADEARYNKASIALMKSLKIPVHNVTELHREQLLKFSKDGVHFDNDGNALLAKALLKYVEENKVLK